MTSVTAAQATGWQHQFVMPQTSIAQQPIGHASTTAGIYATAGTASQGNFAKIPKMNVSPPKTTPGQMLSHSEG